MSYVGVGDTVRRWLRTALQYDSVGAVRVHDLGDDGPKQRQIAVVVDAIVQRHVERIVLALARSVLVQVASTGEEVVAILRGAQCMRQVAVCVCVCARAAAERGTL